MNSFYNIKSILVPTEYDDDEKPVSWKELQLIQISKLRVEMLSGLSGENMLVDRIFFICFDKEDHLVKAIPLDETEIKIKRYEINESWSSRTKGRKKSRRNAKDDPDTGQR